MNVLKTSQSQLGLMQLLVIHDFRIPLIEKNFFEGLYIKRLEITHCQIEAVEKGAFNGLETIIQELSLARNRLKQFPAQALADLGGTLTKLDLSHNEIDDLGLEQSLPRLSKVY